MANSVKYFKLPQEETVTIGDSMNDHPMVVWSNMGVAFGNADPRLMASANMVTTKSRANVVLAAIDMLF
ncbi:MAG: HAD hydrolase family protein [Candidatus Methanomethylophilaceae archaeon]|nr:HAD hydrolase family protein [Candidatus Methanomethylophilaceae archaeon]